jgi:hypothetical protein
MRHPSLGGETALEPPRRHEQHDAGGTRAVPDRDGQAERMSCAIGAMFDVLTANASRAGELGPAVRHSRVDRTDACLDARDVSAPTHPQRPRHPGAVAPQGAVKLSSRVAEWADEQPPAQLSCEWAEGEVATGSPRQSLRPTRSYVSHLSTGCVTIFLNRMSVARSVSATLEL